MGQDPCYFNNCNSPELEEENSPNSDDPFNLNFFDENPQQSHNPLDIINSNNLNDNFKIENNQHYDDFYTTENNQMMEQNYNPNYNNKLNFYKGLKENTQDEFFDVNNIITNKVHEADESYEDFKKGIKTIDNLNQELNNDFTINCMENEIIIYRRDLNDSFIVEQFCLEELMLIQQLFN